MASLCRMSKT